MIDAYGFKVSLTNRTVCAMQTILISSGNCSTHDCAANGFTCWHAATYPVYIKRGLHDASDALSSVLFKYGPDWTTPGLAKLCHIASQLDLIRQMLEEWNSAIDSLSAHDGASNVDEAALSGQDSTRQSPNDKRRHVCMFCEYDQMVEAALSMAVGAHPEWMHLAPLMWYINTKRLEIEEVYNIDLVMTLPDRGRGSNIIRISEYYAKSARRFTEEGNKYIKPVPKSFFVKGFVKGRRGGTIMNTRMAKGVGKDKGSFPRLQCIFPKQELHTAIRECSQLIANTAESERCSLI